MLFLERALHKEHPSHIVSLLHIYRNSQDMESINYIQVSTALTAIAAAVVVAGRLALAAPSVGSGGDDLAASWIDSALDRALKNLVAMPGGPPGVIAIVQRGTDRRVH